MKISDPLLFAVKRYALHDGPNIRTTIFLKGCPLSCFWCHNPEGISADIEVVTIDDKCIGCKECISGCPESALTLTPQGFDRNQACSTCLECVEICPSLAHEAVGYYCKIEEVMAEIEKDVLFFDQSGGGVTFSGGEPLMQPAPLLELLQRCGKLDIHRTIDTTGLAPKEILLEISHHTELFLYDLKHMDSTLHRKYTGVPNEMILDNLKALTESGAEVQLRIPLLAGINDSDENIKKTAAFAGELRNVVGIDILPYHHFANNKYLKLGGRYKGKQTHTPDKNCIARVKTIFENYGHRVRIGG